MEKDRHSVSDEQFAATTITYFSEARSTTSTTTYNEFDSIIAITRPRRQQLESASIVYASADSGAQ